MMPTDPEERSAQLAEYVLGTLADVERAAVEAALDTDPALRAELLFWREKLLGLGARVPVAEPSAGLWSRIESAAHVLESRAPAALQPEFLPWWQRLGLWQGLSAGAALACAALVAVLLVRLPDAGEGGTRYLAVLQSPDTRTAGWVVEASAGGQLRLVPLGEPQVVPTGRALQFWTKARDAAGPTSLGLVAAGQRVEMPVTALPALGTAQLFEITLEPASGSPIGRPTGPILYVGTSFAL